MFVRRAHNARNERRGKKRGQTYGVDFRATVTEDDKKHVRHESTRRFISGLFGKQENVETTVPNCS